MGHKVYGQELCFEEGEVFVCGLVLATEKFWSLSLKWL
jgi:hypothetical protein